MPVDARHGVTTGVSADDRARTVAAAIDPATSPADLVWPGHLHTLAGNPDGVLARAGHTEASLDLAVLAGLTPAAVICEITRPDGGMARRPDLIRFAEDHALSIVTIDELIAYRLQAQTQSDRYAACGAA
jgi:3,4-dihydroxy-2-butanone 4-phosphate synthase